MAGIPEEALEKLFHFRREIDRIFKDFFDPRRPEAVSGGGHVPIAVDVSETASEILIEAELPGLEPDDIELSVLRDVIIIEGHKSRPEGRDDVTYFAMERNWGKFRRIVEIPGAGDTANITAEFFDGLLRVRLPKIEDRRGHKRRLAIQTPAADGTGDE